MHTSGFVDLQVNGYLDVSFSSEKLTAEDFYRVSHALLAHGTAAFLPTVITSSEELYRRNLPLLADCLEKEEFAGRLLGLHIEGPFLSPLPGAIGAHTPAWIKSPDPKFLDTLQNLANGKIKLLTVAADQPGVDELIFHAAELGIAVSLGHHLAQEKDLARAVTAGAVALTHLGNGLPNEVNRHHNPIWAGLAADDLTAMVITDGHHLPESILRSVLRAKGVERIAVVSDASPLAGMPPGKYSTLNNEVVLEESGKLWNPQKKCLVGSSATMLECMNHLHALGMYDLPALLRVGIDNPLRLIGLKRSAVDMTAKLKFTAATGFSLSE